jgi:2-polyprenyl-3-methyl-5-hydroxy-6-metoxy-1,4-benzoquinol methylase
MTHSHAEEVTDTPSGPEARPKTTSYAYGQAYQLEQVEKHRHRRTNHWKRRIALAHDLIDRFALPRLAHRSLPEVKTLDVGCSIGTMAIEMALRGFKSYGVDFDASALRLARELAAEEHVEIELIHGDVAALGQDVGPIDIAVCFDIFEHLHDDELGALLQAIRRNLSDRGSLVFYTFPLQYDYLFFGRPVLHWPLLPFRWLSESKFERLVRAYAAVMDTGLLLTTGKSYKDRIKTFSHCNPTTRQRLIDILERAGYSIGFIDTDNIYPFQQSIARRFRTQRVAHRQLFGVAYPST